MKNKLRFILIVVAIIGAVFSVFTIFKIDPSKAIGGKSIDGNVSINGILISHLSEKNALKCV